MNRYLNHAGSYLLNKEFRYILALKITRLFTNYYKKTYLNFSFYLPSMERKSNYILILTNLHNFVVLITGRSFQFSISALNLRLSLILFPKLRI